MSDVAVRALAGRAGVAVEWSDYAGKRQVVPVDVLRRILAALGLPCASRDELDHSQAALAASHRASPPLVTSVVDRPITIPFGGELTTSVRLIFEDGTKEELDPRQLPGGGMVLPPIGTPGYHTIKVGGRSITLAIAPKRCRAVEDIAGAQHLFGLAVQLYGLRREGDCGIGDMGAVVSLAEAAARSGADALALSPTHAMFVADPTHFSPYSPSNRLFYNPLNADPRALFATTRIAKAMEEAGQAAGELERTSTIDWPRAAQSKLSVFRHLFDDFLSVDLTVKSKLAVDFMQFRSARGDLLEQHARFEALHAHRFSQDRGAWSWLSWPAEWRDPSSPAVADFACRHEREILFHCFLQWLAERSFAAAQHKSLQAGMRIGLVADLAVGMSSGGSHAWARQADILLGLSVGAPPDLFNLRGQNWGLTTFSPRALVHGGFLPFIDTLRAGMRHSGGLRIDHAMGLMRLWVIPDGADAREGAYLSYPLDDLLRLIALESRRHRAVVIGEDLGTVPEGFRERLAGAAIAGMRVLWFERKGKRFVGPSAWPTQDIAMTSTHDLPTVAGWWKGADIALREQLGWLHDASKERADRETDRRALWTALRASQAARGRQPDTTDTTRVAAAAARFIAATPSRLALLPMEDALALEDQPNLPGTVDEYPNWRRRYPTEAATMLDGADVRARLQALARRDEP
jgi:4-alpha-glucanotransferase